MGCDNVADIKTRNGKKGKRKNMHEMENDFEAQSHSFENHFAEISFIFGEGAHCLAVAHACNYSKLNFPLIYISHQS